MQVDNDARLMRVRPDPEHLWCELSLPRPVRQSFVVEDGVLVAWAGPEDDHGDALVVGSDTPQLSCYSLDGAGRWTLDAGELPFFGREGTRLGGVVGVSLVEGRIRLGSGPWYCLVEALEAPTLGRLRHTSDDVPETPTAPPSREPGG